MFFIPFNFLMSFLPSTLIAYIFALSPMVIIAPLFSSFIRLGTFLFARDIYIVCWIIARVESTDIAFHILVNIVAFYMINARLRVGVWSCIYRDTLVTCTRGEIRISRFSICRVCTYPRKSACWTLPRICTFQRRLNFPQRHCDCENSIS